MNIPQRDLLLLHRHLDGELDAAAEASLRARLASEPELARAAAAERELRAGFAAARATTMRPPASFTASVMAAARQLPTRQQLEQADVAGGAVVLCRRLLLAAAVLAGIGLLWHSGVVQHESPATMQASPADVQREIDRLRAELASGRVPPAQPQLPVRR
jgi:anti-sigma factor RsiW